tara:strand:+ start:541 stop:828 length:288 start_codon:yes stop_codon:yes gene_type:complete
MNTLQSHKEEFENGIVNEMGYAAISDAENYDAASSVGAGSVCIAKLWQAFREGKRVSLFSKSQLTFHPSSEIELGEWCEENFPACYGEYLRRAQH